MRNLKDAIKRLSAERTQMFAARDNAVETLHNTPESEAQKILKLKADYADAEFALERLKKQLKWCQDELLRAIENADQEMLFDDAEIDVPLFESEDEGGGKTNLGDTTPVGEPPKTVEIDEYLPGRFKDEDDQESNIYSLDDIRSIAAKRGNDIGMEIKPSSFGVSVYFMDKGKMVGKLDYCGKPKGRCKAG